MISRVSSHLLFCEPEQILFQMVVERDKQIVTDIFSLNKTNAEAAGTSFYDGIISPGIVSIKLNVTEEQFAEIRDKYNYIDFSSENPIIDFSLKKQLLIDFGTEDTQKINRMFPKALESFAGFPVYDFIAACVYYPALITGRNSVIELNKRVELILWEQVDLVGKQLKPVTCIREI